MDEALAVQRVQEVRRQAEEVLGQLRADPAVAPFWQALTELEQVVHAPQDAAREGRARGARSTPLSPAAHVPSGAVSAADLVVQALQEVPLGVCILAGPEHRYTFTNRRYDQVVGRTGIVGQTVREVFPEIMDQGIHEILDHIATTGEPLIVPERHLQLNRAGTGIREDVYFDLSYQPIRAADGRVIGIASYVVDVSDRYNLAQEQTRVLQLTQAALDAADAERQRLLTILEQAPAAICTLEGPDHRYTFTNATYDRFIGRQDVLGKPVRMVVPEVAGQGFFELLDQVYTTGAPQMGTDAPVQLDRHGTGQLDQVFMSYSFAPLRTSQGQITGVFVQLVDVTDLVLARQAAEAAVVLRDQFLSIAAHELRTPLTTLIGYIGLVQRRLRRAGTLDARTDEMLTMLDGQSQRLTRLIATLTDVSRMQFGQLSLVRIWLDVGATVQQVVDEVRVTAPDRTIALTLPPDACRVLGDRLRLEQVLFNLVQNALKYSPDGGKVAVRVGCDAGQVWVQVQDQGMGIPTAALPHLFERFYRVAHRTTAALPGMGLGLAVAHEIVTLHGGTITVESTEGQGSTFTVTLPLANDRAQAGGMA
jgi:signal transduction histidine kinase